MRATENGHGTPPVHQDADEAPELDFNSFTDGFVSDVQGYARAQKDYLLMHVTEKVSDLLGKTVEHMVVFVVIGMSLLFLNVALAFYLGDLLSSLSLGFVIVAGFYLLMLGTFLLWWKNGARERFVLNRINDLSDGN